MAGRGTAKVRFRSRVRRGEGMPDQASRNDKPFRVEEATIDELHRAIREGRTTCVDVVRQYIERVRAYNGAGHVREEAAAGERLSVMTLFPPDTLVFVPRGSHVEP